MSQEARIYLPDFGEHNRDLEASEARITDDQLYRDASTLCLIPTRGQIPARVVMSWFNLVNPMNQRFVRYPLYPCVARGMEVGEAYNQMISSVIAQGSFKQFKFILTLEEDNIPPPDGLIKLIKAMQSGPWAAVGGLYWTKGEGGQPMIYGDVEDPVLNFRPMPPRKDTLQECNGLGMGFTLFDINVFLDDSLGPPWFKTLSEPTARYTQDLYFFENARRKGYRFACDTSVRVGHYDLSEDKVW